MKRAVRRWLLRALAPADDSGRAGGIAALTYHSIDESGSPISFPVERFRAQIQWLASAGYQSLSASQAADALRAGREAPARAVVLTFDDGFRSVREAAWPVLSEHGFAGTVFCAAGYVGKPCGWEGAPSVGLEMMPWQDLEFLAGQGWEIGAHTVSHARLTSLGEAEMRQEIDQGRRILEERLGREVQSFAYPFGAFDGRCAQVVAGLGFASAWTMDPVINRPGCDLFALGRFNCDRIQSDCPETAALAAQVCLGGRYGRYALLTARGLRVRNRRTRKA